MHYRIAFVGAGSRAYTHASAYRLIPNCTLAACCSPTVGKRTQFAQTYGMEAYENLDVMLEEVQPDLVHITTPPSVRVEIMRTISEHQVPACTVEKPLALAVEDWQAISEIASETRTRFAVCHQFRWHRHLLACRKAIESGLMGNLLFLEASARLAIADQGTHTLHYANFLNGDRRVKSVFGALSEWTDDLRHSSPKNVEALITFENGSRLLWNLGPDAPSCGNKDIIWQHVRVAAYAQQGRVLWEEFGNWEVVNAQKSSEGRVSMDDYDDLNLEAQAGFQRDMLTWIECPDSVVGTNLQRSLDEWKVVLALYASALERRTIILDEFQPSPDLEERLRGILQRS